MFAGFWFGGLGEKKTFVATMPWHWVLAFVPERPCFGSPLPSNQQGHNEQNQDLQQPARPQTQQVMESRPKTAPANPPTMSSAVGQPVQVAPVASEVAPTGPGPVEPSPQEVAPVASEVGPTGPGPVEPCPAQPGLEHGPVQPGPMHQAPVQPGVFSSKTDGTAPTLQPRVVPAMFPPIRAPAAMFPNAGTANVLEPKPPSYPPPRQFEPNPEPENEVVTVDDDDSPAKKVPAEIYSWSTRGPGMKRKAEEEAAAAAAHLMPTPDAVHATRHPNHDNDNGDDDDDDDSTWGRWESSSWEEGEKYWSNSGHDGWRSGWWKSSSWKRGSW